MVDNVVCICRVNYRRAEETPHELNLDSSHTQQVRDIVWAAV